MHRISRRRSAALALTVLVGSLPLSMDAGTGTAANETLINSGLAGWPVPVPFGPPGVGVVRGISDDGFSRIYQRMPDGSAFDLESGEAPRFWMGTDADPVLVGVVGEHNLVDLNNDGDELDMLLATSTNGRPFLPIVGDPITLDNSQPVTNCTTRISAQLAVACLSEGDASDDVNSDGDLADYELVLIHGDGSITRPGRFIDNDAGDLLDRTVTVLPDGSVSVGPLRVFPNGTITDIDPVVNDGEVVAVVGTSRLLRIPVPVAQLTFGLLTAGGTLIPLNEGSLHRQVGNTRVGAGRSQPVPLDSDRYHGVPRRGHRSGPAVLGAGRRLGSVPRLLHRGAELQLEHRPPRPARPAGAVRLQHRDPHVVHHERGRPGRRRRNAVVHRQRCG